MNGRAIRDGWSLDLQFLHRVDEALVGVRGEAVPDGIDAEAQLSGASGVAVAFGFAGFFATFDMAAALPLSSACAK